MNRIELIQLASDLSASAPEKISVWGGVVVRLKKEGIDMFAKAIRRENGEYYECADVDALIESIHNQIEEARELLKTAIDVLDDMEAENNELKKKLAQVTEWYEYELNRIHV